MGKQRGPAPTPTKTLELRKSWRAKERKGEPQPDKGRPKMPSWMSKDAYAKTVWKQIVPMLDRMGILTKIDGFALTRYCKMFSRWRKAEEFIEKNGTTYPRRGYNGDVQGFSKFPQVTVAMECASELGRLEAQFGLTPSARTRIRMDEGETPAADPVSKFLNFGKASG